MHAATAVDRRAAKLKTEGYTEDLNRVNSRVKPETVDGNPAVRSLPLRLTKTISTD